MSQLGSVTVGILLLGMCSCATYSGRAVEVRPPNTYGAHVTQGDVIVGGEAYFSPEKARPVFDADVTSGFMPVLLTVRNDAAEFVMIQRSDMILMSSDGKASRPAGWQTMYHEFKTDVTGDTLALGLMAGQAAEEANDKMGEDWQRKQFPEQSTLAKGRGAGGFVYFRQNPGKPPFSVRIVANKMKSQKAIGIELPLE
jgi:hypothetical protein